ncbi:MAG: DUF4082 domain-containing protein [Microlunatus sp.]
MSVNTEIENIGVRKRRRWMHRLALVVVAASVGAIVALQVLLVASPAAAEDAPADSRTLLAGRSPKSTATFADYRSVELGVSFQVSEASTISGLRYYRTRSDGAAHAGTLWRDGTKLATLEFSASSQPGWQYQRFSSAVKLDANVTYVASYHTSSGYAVEVAYFSQAVSNGSVSTASPASRYLYSNSVGYPTDTFKSSNYWIDPVLAAKSSATTPAAATPTPTPTPTASPSSDTSTNGFPGASNTGIPKGTVLSQYTGPMTITTAGTVIDAKEIRGVLVIAAPNVTVSRSKISGGVDSDSSSASVTVSDSEVDGGQRMAPALGYRNLTVLRSNVYGAQHSVLCGTNCRVESSWLHDQYLPSNSDWHVNAFLSNGGSGVQLIGNTFYCTPSDNAVTGGCTADVSFFGDYAPVTNVTVKGNLFKATPGGYCGTFGYNASKTYGKAAANISVTDNVFERGSNGKCGYWGPVTGFPNGNTWSNNRWADGGTIAPAQG